jgi:hypothetical protein
LRFTFVTNAREVSRRNLPGESATYPPPATQDEARPTVVGLDGGPAIPLPLPAIP